MEGKLISEIVDRVAKQDGLDTPSISKLLDAVSFVENMFEGLGFCLSEEGDLLSQWRGYAADATGLSIGFSKDYLELLSKNLQEQKKDGFTLHKVEYDVARQEDLVRPTYQEVKQILDAGQLNIPLPPGLLSNRTNEEYEKDVEAFKQAHRKILLTILKLYPKLYLLKTPAFREEQEWRLISYAIRDEDTSCSFRASNDCIIPYKEIPLTKLDVAPIKEVIIGPKHVTPTHVIERLLKKHGLLNTNIKQSSATYR